MYQVIQKHKYLLFNQVGKGGKSQEFQMRYFCDCESNITEKEMMIQSKRILDMDYSVVGVLEMYNQSLIVFEKYLPGRRTIK